MDKTIERPWYAPRRPDEITPYPWLHPEAVAYLEELLQPDWRVLEHGAGGSTLWFATRVKDVFTIEHSPEWFERVCAVAPSNVTVFLGRDLPGLAPGFDLVFIDGERAGRGWFIQRAPRYLKPGGWIVLDNANRPEYAEERHALHNVAKLTARFDNNIPTSRYFVTEFWCLQEQT